jgi:hypothetical protein
MTNIYNRKLSANDWLMTVKYKNIEVIEWSENLGTRNEVSEDEFKLILEDSKIAIKNNDTNSIDVEYTITSEWINDR